MARNYIKKFTRKTKGYKNRKLPHGNKPGIPQSMCVLSNNTVVICFNKGNAGNVAYLRKYTQNGYVSNSQVANKNLGHCNGMTYCDKTGNIYCTGYDNLTKPRRIVVMNTNFKQLYMFDLPVAISGIAYDRTTEKFYCSRKNDFYVFPISAFREKNRTTSYKHFTGVGAAKSQDVGGYKGIIYSVIWHNSYGDIDLYNHTSGKYIGSIKITYSETESCAFDQGGNFIYLTAGGTRSIHWTNWVPQYTNGKIKNNPSTAAIATRTTNAPAAFVATAEKEVGTRETGNNNQKYGKWAGNNGAAWCAYFVAWCANKTFGNNKIIPKYGMAHDVIHNMVKSCGGKWINKSSSAIKPGDLFVTDHNHNGTADHIGIIQKVSGNNVKTIEGNAGPATDRVVNGTRSISSLWKIARPNWPDGTFTVDGEVVGEQAGGSASLQVHPEQLYSSADYQYIEVGSEETESQKRLKEQQKAIKDFLANIKIDSNNNNVVIPDLNYTNISSASNFKKPRTKVSGNIRGVSLPSTISYVEAPYGKITLGGVSIGTYQGGSFPNYINSITTRRTNGTLNEYTINLTHQIAAGDNPNYIDNLISANGYNKIGIEFGDAASGVKFIDTNPLLINAKSNFDFFNNSINYTLNATSSSVMSIVNKRNYSAVTSKPSTIINKMLYETGELLQYFPGMANSTFVNSNNLIPTNDKEVSIDAIENTTPLNYLNILTSSMVSETSKAINDSVYYLSTDDNSPNSEAYFKIKQIKTNLSASAFPFLYEVDINYPNEDSLVYNFSIDTNYAWPLAYKYAGGIPTYNYGIDSKGKITSNTSTSNLKSTANTNMVNTMDSNWWTNVTEFPITATLEVKGVTSQILLLNYIKVNSFYFGNKRNSSGVYIIIGQEDSLSGNGFRTKFDLLRVAGDNQYITVDGRVLS